MLQYDIESFGTQLEKLLHSTASKAGYEVLYDEPDDGITLKCLDLALLTIHLIESKDNQPSAIIDFIDEVYRNGSDNIKDLIAIGYLDSITNGNHYSTTSSEEVKSFLTPELLERVSQQEEYWANINKES